MENREGRVTKRNHQRVASTTRSARNHVLVHFGQVRKFAGDRDRLCLLVLRDHIFSVERNYFIVMVLA